tara:strand:+ start:3267 stop:5264 length:1998 start_codon:yes stop_codon:yes gene_type:complete
VINGSANALTLREYYDKLEAMSSLIKKKKITKGLRKNNRQGTNNLADLVEDDLAQLIKGVKVLLDSQDLEGHPKLGEVIKQAIAFQSKVNRAHTLLVQLNNAPSYSWVSNNIKGRKKTLEKFLLMLDVPGQLQNIPEVTQLASAKKVIADREAKHSRLYSNFQNEIVSTELSMRDALQKLNDLDEEFQILNFFKTNDCPNLAMLTELCMGLAYDSTEMATILELANTDPRTFDLPETQVHIAAYFKRLAQVTVLYGLAQPEFSAKTQNDEEFKEFLNRISKKSGESLLQLAVQPVQRTMRYGSLFSDLLENAPNDPERLRILKDQAGRFATLIAYTNDSRAPSPPDKFLASKHGDRDIQQIKAKIAAGCAIKMKQEDIDNIKQFLSEDKNSHLRDLGISADVYSDESSLVINYQLANQLGFNVKIEPVNKTKVPKDLEGLDVVSMQPSQQPLQKPAPLIVPNIKDLAQDMKPPAWAKIQPTKDEQSNQQRKEYSDGIMGRGRSVTQNDGAETEADGLSQAPKRSLPPLPPMQSNHEKIAEIPESARRNIPPPLPTKPPPKPFQSRPKAQEEPKAADNSKKAPAPDVKGPPPRPVLISRGGAAKPPPSKPNTPSTQQRKPVARTTAWVSPTKPTGEREDITAGSNKSKNDTPENQEDKKAPKIPKR